MSMKLILDLSLKPVLNLLMLLQKYVLQCINDMLNSVCI